VAHAAGYHSPNNLYIALRRMTGLTPGRVRAQIPEFEAEFQARSLLTQLFFGAKHRVTAGHRNFTASPSRLLECSVDPERLPSLDAAVASAPLREWPLRAIFRLRSKPKITPSIASLPDHDQFRVARSFGVLQQLIDNLFVSPSITMTTTAKTLKITPAAASSNIRKLTEGGVLREVTGRKRDQVFVAHEILRFMGKR
jgi:hypothetical protein